MRFGKLFFGTYLCFCLVPGASPEAEVDLKNANYSDSWTDLTFKEARSGLDVERTYNSRTLFVGSFGFGWCSNFDTTLSVTPEGGLLYTECGAGLETRFYPRDYDERVRWLVDEIIRRGQKGALPGGNRIAELRPSLMTDSELRHKWAARLKIKLPFSPPETLESGSMSAKMTADEYLIDDGDHHISTFNKEGKLIEWRDRADNFIKYIWSSSDLLTGAVDSEGNFFTLEWDNGHIIQIDASNGSRTTYAYDGDNNLVRAMAASGNIYLYQYDYLHDLTKIEFPDATTRLIEYNTTRDWVTSFKDIDGCIEKYNYTESGDPNHFWAIVERGCQGKLVPVERYEFWYLKRPDTTSKYLYKLTTILNEDSSAPQERTVIYDPNGLAQRLEEKGHKVVFFHNASKQLIATQTEGGITAKRYDIWCNQTSAVEFYSISEFWSVEYGFDNACKIVSAVSSAGDEFFVSWDFDGRIKSIGTDLTGRFTIDYPRPVSKGMLDRILRNEKYGSWKIIQEEGQTQKYHASLLSNGSIAGMSFAAVAAIYNGVLQRLDPEHIFIDGAEQLP